MLYELNIKGQSPSYLFGTMHLRSEAAFAHKAAVLEKIDACAAFATEFRLDDADEAKMTRYMNLPSGLLLETLLSPKKFVAVDAFLQQHLNLPLAAFNQSKPLVVSNLISASVFQNDMDLALDAYLYRYAKMKGKRLLGIETFDEQLEIMEKIPLEVQLKALKRTINNFAEHRAEMNELSDLYVQGKTKKLYRLAKKGAKGFRKIMLYDRNAIMAERIAALVREQTICVTIGAAHLEGQRGVLKLLKKQGVKVTKI
jgi:uncharacterized protein